MTLRPVEWEVHAPLDGSLIAIVRSVRLGRRQTPYLRAVTPEADRSQRSLLGYWSTPEEAHDGAIALVEQRTGRSFAGGNVPPRPLVPRAPPPDESDLQKGMAAKPPVHSSRA